MIFQNKVLMPSWIGSTIPEVATANGSFGTLLSLVERVNLADTLSGFGGDDGLGEGWTVFAPTDDAFTKLFESVDPNSLTDDDITKILLDHVVVGPVFSSAVVTTTELTTAGDTTLAIDATSGTIGGAMLNLDLVDIKSKNGVIHVLDEVIILGGGEPMSDAPSMAPEGDDDGAFSVATTFASSAIAGAFAYMLF